MKDTCLDFGSPCKKIRANLSSNLSGDWYLADINPFPYKKDLMAVLSDIEQGYNFTILDGKLAHTQQCNNPEHNLSDEIRKVVDTIKQQYYKIAVFDDRSNFLMGQPIVFIIEPEVNYLVYPDHPHLNAFSLRYGIPTSICYTDNPSLLGTYEGEDRILDALLFATEWVFRHQVWLETRKRYGRGIWIGKSLEPSITQDSWLHLINPKGRCRCGSQKSYEKCCRNLDLLSLGPGPVRNIPQFELKKVKKIEKDLRMLLSHKF
jgi:hypothetical protein